MIDVSKFPSIIARPYIQASKKDDQWKDLQRYTFERESQGQKARVRSRIANSQLYIFSLLHHSLDGMIILQEYSNQRGNEVINSDLKENSIYRFTTPSCFCKFLSKLSNFNLFFTLVCKIIAPEKSIFEEQNKGTAAVKIISISSRKD